jgi:hypothetical protein
MYVCMYACMYVYYVRVGEYARVCVYVCCAIHNGSSSATVTSLWWYSLLRLGYVQFIHMCAYICVYVFVYTLIL